jgi:hypothetical protein
VIEETSNVTHNNGLDSPNADSVLYTSGSRFRLAPFAINYQRGGAPTTGEGSIETLVWSQQVRIAQLAEQAGFEALIAAARWRGYAGDSNWAKETYEGIPWAAGLAEHHRDLFDDSCAALPPSPGCETYQHGRPHLWRAGRDQHRLGLEC